MVINDGNNINQIEGNEILQHTNITMIKYITASIVLIITNGINQ